MHDRDAADSKIQRAVTTVKSARLRPRGVPGRVGKRADAWRRRDDYEGRGSEDHRPVR